MNVVLAKTETGRALSDILAIARDRLPGTGKVADHRRQAFEAYESVGLPHRRIEDWKYTDLRVLMREVLPLAATPDAAAALDAAELESAHVFGLSMGGMIAQEFALQYPARVRSLILGCTAPGSPNAVRAEKRVSEILMARDMNPEDHARAMRPYVYDSSTPVERIEEDLAIRRQWFPKPEAYMAQLQGIFAWESYDRLPGVSAPTLVIHGETDQLVPVGNGKVIASRIPGAQLVMLPHASHIFITDQPEASLKAIMDFLGGQGHAS